MRHPDEFIVMAGDETGMKQELDPIAELLRDLCENGKPSLPWVMKWSVGGRDPVEAAYVMSEDSEAIHEFLTGSEYHRGGCLRQIYPVPPPPWIPAWNWRTRWEAELVALSEDPWIKDRKNEGARMPAWLAKKYFTPPTIEELWMNQWEINLRLYGGAGI